MSSLNKVQLIGNLGKDPEIRQSRDGRPIANFSIATSEIWRDKATGEKQEKTEWHNIVCFNENLTKIIEQYLAKGSKVYVEGKLQTRKWQDRDGNDRYSTEVVMQGFDCKLVMFGGRGDGESRGGGKVAPKSSSRGQSQATDMDDEIPFNFGAGRSLVRPLQKMAA